MRFLDQQQPVQHERLIDSELTLPLALNLSLVDETLMEPPSATSFYETFVPFVIKSAMSERPANPGLDTKIDALRKTRYRSATPADLRSPAIDRLLQQQGRMREAPADKIITLLPYHERFKDSAIS